MSCSFHRKINGWKAGKWMADDWLIGWIVDFGWLIDCDGL